MAATITLQSSITWAQQFLRLRPLAFPGSSNEPAISSANLVKQTILGPPFRWRWNRATTACFTVAAQQDYTLLAWRASAAIGLGWSLVDSNGFVQVCTVGGTTGGSAPAWNSTPGQTTTDNSVTWKNQGASPGGSQAGNWNHGDPATICFIEHASTQSLATDSPANAWNPLEPKLALDLDSTAGPPRYIAAEGDDNIGDITFRLQPVPDQIYPVSITMQQKATLFTALAGLWSPIPDEFSYIYQWGFLALMMLYSDDARFTVCNQKFVAHLLGAAQGLTATQINVFLNQWMAITGQPDWNVARLQQGIQAQGA